MWMSRVVDKFKAHIDPKKLKWGILSGYEKFTSKYVSIRLENICDDLWCAQLLVVNTTMHLCTINDDTLFFHAFGKLMQFFDDKCSL